MIGSTCFRSEYLTLQGRSDAAKRLHTFTGSATLRRAVSDWGIFFWSLLDQIWPPSADWFPLPLPFPLLFSCGLLFHAFLLLELGPGVLVRHEVDEHTTRREHGLPVTGVQQRDHDFIHWNKTYYLWKMTNMSCPLLGAFRP